MRILAFDPGELTGVAVLDDTGWRMGLTVKADELSDMLFSCLIKLARPDVIVIEGSPTHNPHVGSLEANFRINRWFSTAGYPVEKVNPGQWKGMVKASKVSGQHQNDAASMAAWYYRTRLVNVLR